MKDRLKKLARYTAVSLVGIILALLTPISPKVTRAEEETQIASSTANAETESAEEQVLLQSGTDAPTENSIQESMNDEASMIAYVNNLIMELSDMREENVTTKILETIHDNYITLSLAGRSRVENYSIVKKYMEALQVNFPDDTAELKTDAGKKLAQSYVFRIENGQSVSVSVSFVDDTDGDGNADVPVVTLITPSGDPLTLKDGTTTMENANISLALTWNKKFLQLDIKSADEGLWQLQTSNMCVINTIDYAGEKETATFAPEGGTTVPGTTNPVKKQPGNAKGLIILAVFIALVIGGIIVMKKFILVKNDDQKARAKKRRKNRQRAVEEDEDDFENMTEDAKKKELREMEMFLKHQNISSEYDEIDEDENNDFDPNIPVKFDTEEEEEDDDAFEESSEYPSGIIETEDDDDGFGTRFGTRM